MAESGPSVEERRWAACSRAFAIAAAGLLAFHLALAYLVDPYDSGRSLLFSAGAVRPQGPRTAAAMRGRDPAYRGAIIGNSHIQLIEPARLSAQTGIPFVQLSVPGTGPDEQFVLLDWFLRHHAAPEALVVGADDLWCARNPDLPNEKPFPHWLFAEGPARYLRGLLRWSVLEEVVDRIGWLARTRRDEASRDGWWDYEKDYLALGWRADDPRYAVERDRPPPDAPDPDRAGPDYPTATRFAEIVARLPRETALVLVFPPVSAPSLPRLGSPREDAQNACKAAVADALRWHGRSAVVDWRRDRPELHEGTPFFDQSHYRHPLARRLTTEIAEALGRLAAPDRPTPGP